MSREDDRVIEGPPVPPKVDTLVRTGYKKKAPAVCLGMEVPAIKKHGFRKLVNGLFVANIVGLLFFLANCLFYREIPTLEFSNMDAIQYGEELKIWRIPLNLFFMYLSIFLFITTVFCWVNRHVRDE
jgi:hypothetical protein